MYRPERTSRADRLMQERHQHPSFSSSLLDKIYRSIDEPETEIEELRFKKQSKSSVRTCRVAEDSQVRQISPGLEKRLKRRDDEYVYDRDATFYSSNSSSSDSSSVGFSSSDTESMYGTVKSRASSFVPPSLPRPKPVRTSVAARSERSKRTEEKQRSLSQEIRRVSLPLFDDYNHSQFHPSMEDAPVNHDEGIIKSKSRALKIYANLKKVKQPISPGGRLASFINSLFTPGNVKKAKNCPAVGGFDDMNSERNSKSGQASTCSSACSFSRSCLSKNSPGRRERLRNGPKRSVRFYPVSIILDEDLKPCGQKSLYGQEDSGPMPCARPYARKLDDEKRHSAAENSRKVEEVAKELFRDYHRSQRRNNLATKSLQHKDYRMHEEEEADDDDDDAASCSSSDLFELDHLAIMGDDSRYCQELPVYETTHFDLGRNLAIANGLMV